MLNSLKKSSRLSVIAALLLMGAGIFWQHSWLGRAEAQQPRAPAPPRAMEGAKTPELSAQQVRDGLLSNHALADEQLVGKRLRVHGIASKIRRKVESERTKYILQMAVVRNGTTQELAHFYFEFQEEDRTALAAVVLGCEVTVEGLCTQPKSEEAYFKDCEVIKPHNL